jgi:hypothetical protein
MGTAGCHAPWHLVNLSAPHGVSGDWVPTAAADDGRRPPSRERLHQGVTEGITWPGACRAAAAAASQPPLTADQAKGLDAIFRSVASSQYGPWLLALLASGLFCYGLYGLLEARYRDLTSGQ